MLARPGVLRKWTVEGGRRTKDYALSRSVANQRSERSQRSDRSCFSLPRLLACVVNQRSQRCDRSISSPRPSSFVLRPIAPSSPPRLFTSV
ncbi:MAG: hypothetical protein HUU23_03470 [Caldilineales bacterium]|nr:hypothetical protein [Caldilineales bacterium]